MADSVIPKISARLRKVLLHLAEHPSAAIERLTQQIKAEIPNYENAAEAVLRDLRESIADMHGIWYQTLLSGKGPTVEVLEQISAVGRRRVHQSVSLESLLRAFRIGSKEIWASLLREAESDTALHQELLYRVSPYVFDHFDLMAQTIAQAYVSEQFQRARWRDALVYELCSILFNRPEDEDGFRESAQALGLDATLTYCALRMNLHQAQAMPAPGQALERLVLRILRALRVPAESVLHTVHRGQLLMWLPLSQSETPISGEQRITGQARPVLDACGEISAIGVGLPAMGARGWRASADQALKALETGFHGETIPGVRPYSDIALNDAVAASDNVNRYFDAIIERLAQEPQLLVTLETYFEKRQHRKAAAAALDIHPNTLNYRLERIEILLGARLDEVGWLAKLHTALRLHRMNAHPRA